SVDAVVGFVTGIPGRLQHLAATAFAVLKTAITGAKNWISDRIDDIVGFVAGIPSRIAGVAGAMYDAGRNIMRSLVDGLIAIWNSTLGGKGSSIPGWVPGVGGKGFHFPKFHTGGKVLGPIGAKVPILELAGKRVLSVEQTR